MKYLYKGASIYIKAQALKAKTIDKCQENEQDETKQNGNKEQNSLFTEGLGQPQDINKMSLDILNQLLTIQVRLDKPTNKTNALVFDSKTCF